MFKTPIDQAATLKGWDPTLAMKFEFLQTHTSPFWFNLKRKLHSWEEEWDYNSLVWDLILGGMAMLINSLTSTD